LISSSPVAFNFMCRVLEF